MRTPISVVLCGRADKKQRNKIRETISFFMQQFKQSDRVTYNNAKLQCHAKVIETQLRLSIPHNSFFRRVS